MAGLVALRAAAQDSDVTFSTNVKVVSMLATVLNKQGQIVRDLSKDIFGILENGRPQTIRYFSRDTDLPLTLGLLVDTSMSQVQVIESERAASFRFIDQVLRENKDQVFVMQFDMSVQTSQELTSSRDKLRHALAFVDTPTRSELRNQYGGGTLLFDAVMKASREIMSHRQGRKALIIMSDGGENGSDSTMLEGHRRGPSGGYGSLLDSVRRDGGPQHPAAHVEGDGRRVFRGHEEVHDRSGLRCDRG